MAYVDSTLERALHIAKNVAFYADIVNRQATELRGLIERQLDQLAADQQERDRLVSAIKDKLAQSQAQTERETRDFAHQVEMENRANNDSADEGETD